MARPCTVCEHPDRAAVDIGLANGIAARVLGLRYGLSPDALARHKERHVGADLIAKLRVRANRTDEELAKIREVEGKSLLDNFAWQRAQLYRNADACASIKDWAGHKGAMDAASKITERIGKLLGELGSAITINHNTINLVQSPQWHAIRTALVRELRPVGHEAIAAGARAIAAAEASIARPDMLDAGHVPLLIEANAEHE